MNDFADNPPLLEVVEVSPRRKGHPVLAWIVIVLCVLGLSVGRLFLPAAEEPAGNSREDDPIALVAVKLQGRYLVGAAEWVPTQKRDLADQIAALNSGPPGQRFRFVVLKGELAGPSDALRQLEELEQQFAKNNVALSPDQVRVKDILERLYTDYAANKLAAPSLAPEDRAVLQDQLGWFGDLALAPKDGPDSSRRQAVLQSAQWMFLIIVAAFFCGGLLTVAGLIGLIVLFVCAINGSIRGGLPNRSRNSGIYAETFAVWMVLFIVLDIGAALAPFPDSRLLIFGLATLLSLLALGWPVLRGVAWRQVRQEIGLHLGRNPLLEPLLGLCSYVMTLPLLVGGLLVVLILMALQGALTGTPDSGDFGSARPPSHPIVEFVIKPDWWLRLQIFFAASVTAPIVEETMFRGVLYRHVRAASGKLGLAVSMLISGTVVSFIFAVIHPQGFIAVPALMALAFGFTLAREWRGSLVPSMVAHGLNNGLLMLLLILALGA
jgi:membrane protease YdiL (CAAX protease family)